MSPFKHAVSFLTRIPIRPVDGPVPKMSDAVPWFGVVGLLLGTTQAAIYVGLTEVATRTVAASVAIAVLALITGAFHHDGLADMADAFGGGWTPEQRLEILNDSRLGTYGVTSLIMVIAIEISALSSLSGWVAAAAVIVAHGLSRTSATTAMVSGQPARDSGLGVDFVRELSHRKVNEGLGLMYVVTLVLFGAGGLILIVAALAATRLVMRLAEAKIGGISGDVLGAIQQITKAVTLVAVVIFANAAGTPNAIAGGLAFSL